MPPIQLERGEPLSLAPSPPPPPISPSTPTVPTTTKPEPPSTGLRDHYAEAVQRGLDERALQATAATQAEIVSSSTWPELLNLEWQPAWEWTGDIDPHAAEGEETNDPRTRLSATIRMFGTHFHIEAIQVNGDSGEWTAVNPGLDSNIEHLVEINGDGDFTVTEIDGRNYIIMMFPFSS